VLEERKFNMAVGKWARNGVLGYDIREKNSLDLTRPHKSSQEPSGYCVANRLSGVRDKVGTGSPVTT
jgi:hypothetical protein